MNFQFKNGLLLLVLPLFFFYSNGKKPSLSHSDECTIPVNRLKEGDIILRKGKGLISELLSKTALEDQTFSHAGIILKFGNQWMVCHAFGGESNPVQGVQLESVNDFTNQRLADSIAVFRYKIQEEEVERLRFRCMEYVRSKVPFDSHFDINDDASLYCTEMVSKAYTYATRERISLP